MLILDDNGTEVTFTKRGDHNPSFRFSGWYIDQMDIQGAAVNIKKNTTGAGAWSCYITCWLVCAAMKLFTCS